MKTRLTKAHARALTRMHGYACCLSGGPHARSKRGTGGRRDEDGGKTMPDLLTGALPDVPLSDQIATVAREIAMRRKVYPRWIAAGRMKHATADEEIRRMEAVLVTLEGLKP